MAKMDFFEKPGCINGEKQKTILEQGGNALCCINILEHHWSQEDLLPFIASKEPVEFMNHTAPAIKSGKIVPKKLTFDEAVALMLVEPILIQRPLIRVDGMHIQGFTDERLKPYLGKWDGNEDVVTCPKLHTISCDQ